MNTSRDMDEAKDFSTEYVEFPHERSVPFGIPKVTWWKHSGLRRLYIMMPILFWYGFKGSTINGYDGSLLNGLQTMPSWRDYFGNPTGSDLGLLTAIHNIGGISALLFYTLSSLFQSEKTPSHISDLLDRRAGVALGIIVIFVGVIVQSVPSVNRNMFVGGRFLVGCGSNVSQGSAPLLAAKLAHPQHRGTSIIAAWTVFGTIKYTSDASWRILVALQTAMPVIQFFGVWLLPESSLALRKKARQKMQNSGNSWLLLVKTPGNRKRLLLIALVSFFSQCSGNRLSVGITSSSDQAVINGGLQIWSFLVAIGFSAFLVDALGRRKLFMIAAIGMLVTFSVWTGCSSVYDQNGNSGAGGAVIATVFLYYGVAGFAWPGLTVAYCVEILLFNIRANGIAINIALTALSSCLCIYSLFVETKGPTLKEVAALFDGKSVNISSAEELGIRLKAVTVDKELS
ncbi:major facilitator superfamily domain-containing protein [Aspergillus filifer]